MYQSMPLDVLVLVRFVSFPGLKNEAYTCVLSLFRRAFAPFHSFTVLVSTRGFKRASPSRITAQRHTEKYNRTPMSILKEVLLLF